MPTPVVLDVDGVGKSFGDRRVLTAASFRARKGTITALMGRNGAGKSTLLRVAIGRVRPHYGRVLFHGEYLVRPNLAAMARAGLFYSAQDSAVTDLFTVREHLAAVAKVYGGNDRVGETVSRLALEEFLDRKPPTLSGGERQRAPLAMAMVRAPSCLIMDEPFVGIAPKDRALVTDGLRALRSRGCAIVISGHDVEDVFELADEITWVVAGTTHVLGSPEAARTHDQFRREYLGG
jgi:lipopolysaccharide export system ATP-binding protein